MLKKWELSDSQLHILRDLAVKLDVGMFWRDVARVTHLSYFPLNLALRSASLSSRIYLDIKPSHELFDRRGTCRSARVGHTDRDAIVIAELEFCKVPVQIVLGAMLVHAAHPRLKMLEAPSTVMGGWCNLRGSNN